jgi:hypothetical protein
MVTRRELFTTGALGAFSATASEGARAEAQSNEDISAQALRGIHEQLRQIHQVLDDSLGRNSLAFGVIGPIRRQFEQFLRSNQKYPDYCEVGPAVFTDLYDWHVKNTQPIQTQRVDNRLAIRFMFTWMILLPHQDPGFLGIPFDKG